MHGGGCQDNKRTHFNDLLLPVVLTLCVMPFVIYFVEYDYGYSGYEWHSVNSVAQDFYTYYRGIFFLAIACFAAVILLFRWKLYRERMKRNRLFLFFLLYALFALLSAAFSGNPKVAWSGGFVDFEGAFVLCGYCLIGYYAYQIMEREQDYKSIVRAVFVMFVPMSVIGWLQVFRHDLLNYEWLQRLVMPDKLYAVYGGEVEDVFTGNNVFLSLYNPNFAAVFLVMFTALFTVLFLAAVGKKERIVCGIFLLDALTLCWFTYTRAALFGLAVALFILAAYKGGGVQITFLRRIIWCGLAFVLVLFIVDAANGGKYLGRMLDKPKDNSLEEIVTHKEGVEVTYARETYLFCLEEGYDGASTLALKDGRGNSLHLTKTKDGDYRLPFSKGGRADIISWYQETQMVLWIDEMTFCFVKQDGNYLYCTDWGKKVPMKKVPHADFHGWEYLGSGRIYIWSRILPILKKYIILGSGPCTFAESFPQNDYVGKSIYAENPARIIERAHNDFLMRWVQTGLVSLLALLAFYGLFLWKGFRFYRRCTLDSMRQKLGFGCFLGCVGYLTCCLFNDSTLYTTPVFYVFVGIALAGMEEDRGRVKAGDGTIWRKYGRRERN